MFDQGYENRLRDWSDFRLALETHADPIHYVMEKYTDAPTVSMHTDPWTQEMWPNPWELIEENTYCEFCKLLGICYSLQLTDRFSQGNFEIHIGIDDVKSSSYYLLFINNFIIGYRDDTYISSTELPSSFRSQQAYPMPRLN